MNDNLLDIFNDFLECRENIDKNKLDQIMNHSTMINSFLLEEFKEYFKNEDLDYIIRISDEGLLLNELKKYKIDYDKKIIFNSKEKYNLIMPKDLANIFSSKIYEKNKRHFWELFFYENQRFLGLNIFLANS